MTEPLDNIEVLKQLLQQRQTAEQELERARNTFLKLNGAIEALEQIESSKLAEGETLAGKLGLNQQQDQQAQPAPEFNAEAGS